MRYKHSYTRIRFLLQSGLPCRSDSRATSPEIFGPAHPTPTPRWALGVDEKMGEVQRVPRSTSAELDVRWLLRYFVSVVWLLLWQQRL